VYGWLTNTLASPITIDNSANHYTIFISLGDTYLENQFRDVVVYYQLQVSPAPAVATFTDVPTDYWAFQYIEALAASGITVASHPPRTNRSPT